MIARITDFDVVTAYGWGMDALWEGLMSGRTAIGGSGRFAERGFVSEQMAVVPGLEVGAGESRVMAMLRRLLEPLAGRIDPGTAVILATTVGEIEYLEKSLLEQSVCEQSVLEQSVREKSVGGERGLGAGRSNPFVLLRTVQEMLGLTGSGMVVSSACASSTAALSQAASLVKHGIHPAVLVVCCDGVSEFVYSGFSSLLSLSEKPARPFDVDRNGLTLGEAAAWVMVTNEQGGGAVEIAGWGNTSDAIHMTAPDRHGNGLVRAIRKAEKMAGRSVEEVGFIAAHGTATLYSDAMELRAFSEAIGSARPVFSIKGGIGHTLGAAGIAQVLVAGRALTEQCVPPNIGVVRGDESGVHRAVGHAVRLNGAASALCTNSGFGGVNTALILRRGSGA